MIINPRALLSTILGICSVLILYVALAFWLDEANVDPSVMHKKVAVIYAAPTFHEEVASSAACIMHELGYHTVVYIGNGYQLGGMMVPFSGRRRRDAEKFYGSCVSQFVTIRDPLMMVQNPSIVIFVTYPMENHNGKPDMNALALLDYVRSTKKNTPVVLITHHSESYLNGSAAIFDHIPSEQTTFMFLGEHTQKDAALVTKARVHDEKQRAQYHLSHFYPTIPMHYIAGDQGALTLLEHHEQRKDDTVFAIQGHFGGKHAHRKDPLSVIECLRGIENGYVPAGAKTPSGKAPSLNIDLIGHVLGNVKVGHMKHSRISFVSDLGSADYYIAIAKARFMVAAIREHTYYTEKATSSVPAALIAEIPLVATKEFLNVYPCLRDAPLHKRINREFECDSVYEAVHLTEAEYMVAKDEARHCNALLWGEAKTTFLKLIAKGTPAPP